MLITGIILIVLGINGLLIAMRINNFPMRLILCMATAGCILLGIAFCIAPKTQKEYKYPASEYRLDYEIITRGEHVDTVYVLTKKQNYDTHKRTDAWQLGRI